MTAGPIELVRRGGWPGVDLDVEVDWRAVEEITSAAYHTIACRGR